LVTLVAAVNEVIVFPGFELVDSDLVCPFKFEDVGFDCMGSEDSEFSI